MKQWDMSVKAERPLCHRREDGRCKVGCVMLRGSGDQTSCAEVDEKYMSIKASEAIVEACKAIVAGAQSMPRRGRPPKEG